MQGVRAVRTILMLLAVLLPSGASAAEWQLRPFAGVKFGGDTTFVDLDEAIGRPRLTFGGNVLLLGEVFGVEVDVGYTPNSFNGDRGLILKSHTSTLMGSAVVALPRHISRYTLRPYAVGGAGLVRVSFGDYFGAIPVDDTLAGINVGGGATGFLTDRVGLNWELRYFRTLQSAETTGLSFGAEALSFWRATMGVTIRR